MSQQINTEADLPETGFYEAVKNFSEEELIQYVREGHRPPRGQAVKIRKKREVQSLDVKERSSKLERSIVILASGTIFRTGKRDEIVGNPSVPGGNESLLLGEGERKRAFLVKDLNTGRELVIRVSKQKLAPALPQMKKECFITARIRSAHVLPVHLYTRTTRCMKMNLRIGYLESDFCNQGTLEERPALLQDPAIREQALKAVREIHQSGFAHLDLHEGNIGFRTGAGNESIVTILDFENAVALMPNDPMKDVDHMFLNKIFSLNHE